MSHLSANVEDCYNNRILVYGSRSYERALTRTDRSLTLSELCYFLRTTIDLSEKPKQTTNLPIVSSRRQKKVIHAKKKTIKCDMQNYLTEKVTKNVSMCAVSRRLTCKKKGSPALRRVEQSIFAFSESHKSATVSRSHFSGWKRNPAVFDLKTIVQ